MKETIETRGRTLCSASRDLRLTPSPYSSNKLDSIQLLNTYTQRHVAAAGSLVRGLAVPGRGGWLRGTLPASAGW